MSLEIDSDSDCELVPPERPNQTRLPSRETVLQRLYKPAPPAGSKLASSNVATKVFGFATGVEHKDASSQIARTAPAKLVAASGSGRDPDLKALFRMRRDASKETTGAALAVASSEMVPKKSQPAKKSDVLLSQYHHEDGVRASADGLTTLLEATGVLPSVAARVAAAAGRSARKKGEAHWAAERRRWRSLLWNLRQNRRLLEDVNTGATSAMQLLAMSHEDLAEEEVKKRRRLLQAESLQDVILHDQSTFKVLCPGCGNQEAQGVMAHVGNKLEDDGWGQQSMRGICKQCGYVWVDGRG